MKTLFYSLLLSVLLQACGQNSPTESSTNDDQIDNKVDSVLALMTLEEKIGQLNQYSVGEEMTGPGNKEGEAQRRYELLLQGKVGSVLNLLGAENTYKLQKQVVENSRLGIPLLFAYDVIHGYKTIFPIPLGESASWDLELVKKTAEVAAIESAASGLHWTFAPMVDISYDARWGRVMEGAGEDPYLTSQIAAARVKGFQFDDLSNPLSIAACAKHFAGYGFVQSGKDYNNVNFDRNRLFNEVLPPFKASMDAGAATFMTAFNDFEATPASGNDFLIRHILKGTWDYDGVLVSDWNAIGEMVNHRVALDNREAAKRAIMAGTDIDMEADAYSEHLSELVNKGEIDEQLIDDAVRRVLKLKFQLGLFDDPYRYSDTAREQEYVGHEDHIQLAHDAALKSIVLLKNEKNILPLKPTEKIALIGPLVKDKDTPLGNWRAKAEPNSAVSVFEGITDKISRTDQLHYARACKLSIGPNNFFEKLVIEKEDRTGFAEAIAIAKKVDKVVMVLGETAYMSGEARSVANIGLPGLQLDLLKEIYAVNKNIVLVLMNGRPLALEWEAAHIPAILETWHLGSQAGHAIADVLYGDYNPSGKLPMSFPRNVGQLPMQYHHKTSGRPTTSEGQVFYVHHADVEPSALFPFGFGLSYTSFDLSEPTAKTTKWKVGEQGEIQITVTNTGQMAGAETVQLYIKDDFASLTRPEKELKAFQKVFLEAGESKNISFVLTDQELGFYNNEGEFIVEAGGFSIMIGNDSQNLQSLRIDLTN